MTGTIQEKINGGIEKYTPAIVALAAIAIAWGNLSTRVSVCEKLIDKAYDEAQLTQKNVIEMKNDINWIKTKQNDVTEKLDNILKRLESK